MNARLFAILVLALAGCTPQADREKTAAVVARERTALG